MLSIRDRVEDAMSLHTPRLYLSLVNVAHWVRRRGNMRGYADLRRDFNYYREVARLAKQHVPSGRSVIDVGANEIPLIDTLEGYEYRVALDRRLVPNRPGIERVTVDFACWRPDRRYDLVLCLQVLEHLPDPAPFARKLFDIGDWVIISVPYRWRKGACPGHVQDPVDELKLRAWTGLDPIETRLVYDGAERLIAVYAPREDPGDR